jgi:hypothetical protein
MINISVRGKKQTVQSVSLGGADIIVTGRLVRTAEVFDQYWLEAKSLPDPVTAIEACRAMPARPDLFTFAQRVPNTAPAYDYYREFDNVAVIPLTTYEAWLKQVSSATRRNIKAAHNRGVEVRVAPYDETYVRGIMSIYNESPIRQGRRFWHYGKPFEAVQAENGTYADRATFLAAYVGGEMVGYLKVVWDDRTGAIMQVMAQTKHYDKRPNNALLAEAVKQACARGVEHLQYESFVYGNKTDSSLTDYKRSNGFERMDVPRYFVPLTARGALALRLGLHRDQKDRLPSWVRTRIPELRAKWYRMRTAQGEAVPAPAAPGQTHTV